MVSSPFSASLVTNRESIRLRVQHNLAATLASFSSSSSSRAPENMSSSSWDPRHALTNLHPQYSLHPSAFPGSRGNGRHFRAIGHPGAVAAPAQYQGPAPVPTFPSLVVHSSFHDRFSTARVSPLARSECLVDSPLPLLLPFLPPSSRSLKYMSHIPRAITPPKEKTHGNNEPPPPRHRRPRKPSPWFRRQRWRCWRSSTGEVVSPAVGSPRLKTPPSRGEKGCSPPPRPPLLPPMPGPILLGPRRLSVPSSPLLS